MPERAEHVRAHCIVSYHHVAELGLAEMAKTTDHEDLHAMRMAVVEALFIRNYLIDEWIAPATVTTESERVEAVEWVNAWTTANLDEFLSIIYGVPHEVH